MFFFFKTAILFNTTKAATSMKKHPNNNRSNTDYSIYSFPLQFDKRNNKHANILLLSTLQVQNNRSSDHPKTEKLQFKYWKKKEQLSKQKEDCCLHISRAHFLINFPIFITLKSYPYISPFWQSYYVLLLSTMSAQKKEIKSWKWENMDLVPTFYKITNLLLTKFWIVLWSSASSWQKWEENRINPACLYCCRLQCLPSARQTSLQSCLHQPD